MKRFSPLTMGWRLWLLNLGFWTLVGVMNSASEIIDIVTGDWQAQYWEPVVWEMSSQYAYALLCPLLIAFALRFPFTRHTWGRILPLHFGALIAFSLLHIGAMVSMRHAAYGVAGRTYAFGNLPLETLYELLKDSGMYWVIVGLTYGFDYYRRYRQRELETERLKTDLARAQLDNIRSRLHPHFLFNTLNTISSIMHENVAWADAMIARLSDLIRLSFDTAQQHEVPLQRELATLQVYIEIMKARHHDRLAVETDVDPATRDALVPALILQPLVENAIKYGVSSRPDGGHVLVRSSRTDGRLRLEVRDDGPGVAGTPRDALNHGFGLSSTAARLEHLYGTDQRIDLENLPGGGFSVRLDLPLHPTNRAPTPTPGPPDPDHARAHC